MYMCVCTNDSPFSHCQVASKQAWPLNQGLPWAKHPKFYSEEPLGDVNRRFLLRLGNGFYPVID